jgi:hypothetical protein
MKPSPPPLYRLSIALGELGTAANAVVHLVQTLFDKAGKRKKQITIPAKKRTSDFLDNSMPAYRLPKKVINESHMALSATIERVRAAGEECRAAIGAEGQLIDDALYQGGRTWSLHALECVIVLEKWFVGPWPWQGHSPLAKLPTLQEAITGVLRTAQQLFRLRDQVEGVRELCQQQSDAGGSHAEANASHRIHKPDGWTKKDLIDQAKAFDVILTSTTFWRIRRAAKVNAPPKGGKGPHYKFSMSDLRKMIAAVERGRVRKGAELASAWRDLLPGDAILNHR